MNNPGPRPGSSRSILFPAVLLSHSLFAPHFERPDYSSKELSRRVVRVGERRPQSCAGIASAVDRDRRCHPSEVPSIGGARRHSTPHPYHPPDETELGSSIRAGRLGGDLPAVQPPSRILSYPPQRTANAGIRASRTKWRWSPLGRRRSLGLASPLPCRPCPVTPALSHGGCRLISAKAPPVRLATDAHSHNPQFRQDSHCKGPLASGTRSAQLGAVPDTIREEQPPTAMEP